MAWADDVLREIDSAKDSAAVFDTVQHAALALGFEYCAYGVRIPVPVTRPQVIMLNNYPKAWQDRYASRGYLDVDPTVLHGRRSQRPVVWDDQLFREAPDLWDDARDIGLRVGWAKSSLDGQCAGGMLTLARSGEPLTAVELESRERYMCWLANVAHLGFRRVHAEQWTVSLTPREKEVLRWAADGKTFEETSEILDISVATVKYHTQKASTKLGTVNRVATVARAAVLGLLAE